MEITEIKNTKLGKMANELKKMAKKPAVQDALVELWAEELKVPAAPLRARIEEYDRSRANKASTGPKIKDLKQVFMTEFNPKVQDVKVASKWAGYGVKLTVKADGTVALSAPSRARPVKSAS